MANDILFSPVDAFKNRIVMAPMTRSRALKNIPNDLMAKYYAQRATAGLIITEGTSPSPNGLGYARIPGIFNQDQIDGWKKVTEAVHAEGGKIFVQLMHTGRVTHRANLPQNALVLAPSAISANLDMWTDEAGLQITDLPAEMTVDDVKSTIAEYVQAAKNAITAGFDGIEIHTANGYLPEQFLNPGANVRTDEYGGSVENRTRFVVETIQGIASQIGADRVGIRISPYSTYNAMPAYAETSETYEHLVSELEKLGIHYVHVVDYSAKSSEEGVKLLTKIRSVFKRLIIVNGGYNKDKATLALENNEADLISFGSLFISNPDLPNRFRNDLPLTSADPATFYTADANGYLDYPTYQI